MNRTQLFDAIFGDETCKRIAKIGNKYSRTCWDIANEVAMEITLLERMKSEIVTGKIYSEISSYILAFGVMDVYQQMGVRMGIKRRTLRDYHSVASFYSTAEIEQFMELPFSHFRFARQFGHEKAIRLLALSLRQKDLNGFVAPSVEWLEANLHNAGGDDTVIDDLESVQNFDDNAMAFPVGDFETDDNDLMPASVYYFVHSVKRLMDSMLKRISRLNLPVERKEKIMMMIATISDLAEELKTDSVPVPIDSDRAT